MRILLVTNNYTPYSGGVVRSLQTTSQALMQQGHEVFLVTLDFVGGKHDDPSYVFRVPSLVRCMYRQNYMAIAWRPTRHLTFLIQKVKPDVIHVQHPFLLGSIAARVARRYHIPVVFTHHTLYEHYSHYVPMPRILVNFMIRFLVARFCRNVDGIIAPSHAVADRISQYNIPTLILPSGLAKPFVSLPLQLKSILKDQPIRLLTVGRLVPEKNIVWLLDLMAQIRELPVVLTIVGYGSLYQELRDYAYHTLQLGDRVIFVHKPSEQQLLDEYQAAHLFLFSSTTDTQGLVLAEAMASSLPVIAIDGPGQRDIIKQGENGYLVYNHTQMIESICSIMDDCELYERLQRGAWKTAQKYDPHMLVDRLVSFYKSVARKR